MHIEIRSTDYPDGPGAALSGKEHPFSALRDILLHVDHIDWCSELVPWLRSELVEKLEVRIKGPVDARGFVFFIVASKARSKRQGEPGLDEVLVAPRA